MNVTVFDEAVVAARWIGFSEEVQCALQTPTPELLPALMLLVRLPDVRALHAGRGIPEEVTKATLRDIEVWIRAYREKHGIWGFDQSRWGNEHFSGRLVALGRLQFQIAKFRLPEVPGVLASGDPVLDVHIPATGKLDDEACGESFRQAESFFPCHFPEHEFKAYVCSSWMMDRQLERALPAGSNLVRFLRRFHPLDLPDANDNQMWERVFGQRYDDPVVAPRDTALRRTILDHIARGGHWRSAAGYMPRRA